MNKEFDDLKNLMDGWVKDFNVRLYDSKDVKATILEHTDLIHHNYELINELGGEIDEIRDEMDKINSIQQSLIKHHFEKHAKSR